MGKTVQEQVVEIIAEQAMMDAGDVALTAKLEDLGIDSLGLVEAVFAIEETFDVQVPFNANNPEESHFDISSVSAIVKAVENLVAASG